MRRLDPSADVGVGWRSADSSMYVDEKLVTWFSTCWCRRSVACATARASPPAPVAVADAWSGLGMLVALAAAARAAARASTTAAASAAPSAVAKMPPSLPEKKNIRTDDNKWSHVKKHG